MHQLLSGALLERWAVKLTHVARHNIPKWALAFLAVGLIGLAGLAEGKTQAPVDLTAPLPMSALTRQGLETYNQIHQGGPFAYEKDGVVFGNRERQLPLERRGYYREYTVKTPGSRNRGARRIVCGGQPKTPDACYYTDDHYASFRKIVP